MRSSGFDILRFAALAMVVWQHVLSLHGITPEHLLPGLDVGQLGVTIFCAISGYFAIGGAERSSWRWLGRRLERIYIPLWLTLIPLFALNAVLGAKDASIWLIVSEFAGTALFTHGGQLIVGAHLWFISLILLCYLLAAPVRRFPILLPIVVCCLAFAGWGRLPLARYLLVFFIAGTIRGLSLGTATTIWLLAAMTAACWLLGGASTVFIPSAVGLAAVAAAKVISTYFHWPAQWSWPAKTTDASYHFYLAHGPVLRGLATLGWFGLAADTLIGACLTLVASAVLYLGDASARQLIHTWVAYARPAPVTLNPQ